MWSSSSTQFFFNIDHPAILELRANSDMKGDLVSEIVPYLHNQIQATVVDIEKLTIQQLYDVELPVGKAVSYSYQFTNYLTT